MNRLPHYAGMQADAEFVTKLSATPSVKCRVH